MPFPWIRRRTDADPPYDMWGEINRTSLEAQSDRTLRNIARGLGLTPDPSDDRDDVIESILSAQSGHAPDDPIDWVTAPPPPPTMRRESFMSRNAIIWIAVIGIILLVGGCGIFAVVDDDGTNVRTASAEALNALPADANDAALHAELDKKLDGDDLVKVESAAKTAHNDRKVSWSQLASDLTNGKGNSADDTASILNGTQVRAVGTTPAASPSPSGTAAPTGSPTTGTTPVPGTLTDADLQKVRAMIDAAIMQATAQQNAAMATALTELRKQFETVAGQTKADIISRLDSFSKVASEDTKKAIEELKKLVNDPNYRVQLPTPAAGATTPAGAPTPSGTPNPGGQRVTKGDISKCLTTGEAQDRIGLNVVRLREEPCTWTWRSLPDVYPATCPTDFYCTMHEDGASGKVVVQVGHGQIVPQVGTTFRYVPGFPNEDDIHLGVCKIYQKEVKNGLEEKPSFPVFYRQIQPADMACPDAKKVEARSDNNLNTSSQGSSTSGDEVTLTVDQVAKWCNPDCTKALEPLVESNGKVNPAGVKLKSGFGCFTLTIPDNINYDGWTGKTTVSGQTAGIKTYCEASLRNRGTDPH